MAYINVNSPCPVFQGMPITFKAPCDCTAVEGLVVAYGDNSYTFAFKDAHGNTLTGVGNLFMQGALVKAILDIEGGYAYLQNADTNAYIERTFARKDVQTTDTILPAWGYRSGEDFLRQEMRIEGVTADSVVDIALTPTATTEQVKAFQRLNLQGGEQGDGYFFLRAFGTANTIAIPINVVIRDYGGNASANGLALSFDSGTLTLL